MTAMNKIWVYIEDRYQCIISITLVSIDMIDQSGTINRVFSHDRNVSCAIFPTNSIDMIGEHAVISRVLSQI